jgi:type IV pilus assembly protein PilC
MLVLIVGIFFFMMAYVVPQVMSFLKSTNQELPFYTEALIATSDFVQDNVVMLILLPIVAFIINKIVRRASPGYCFFMDETLLKLPVLGSIVRKISIARFTHFFATMFQAGVPILQCLSTSGRVITNMKLRDSIEQVGEQVQNGVAFSDAMRQTGEFPSLVVRMIRIGEDSGNLSQTLENVTEFYDQDVNESIDSLIAMIEPALIAVTGLLMAWIIISVFGPIYDSFGNLGI